ncbi:cytochrome c oxidase assembly protein [Neotabrizicola sp. sgz301269]|uniref:cytochrome c oxidase assembly protein n=1 Tax=Neotabrizicola sp. sgz301269 TaxID=3276282 RepID=UPI0037706FA9
MTLAPKRTALWLTGIAAGMLGLSFAAVPLYDLFCRMTGFGGTTSVSEVAPDTILDQTVKVRFDASLEAGMPWTFKPVVPEMTIRLGETGLAFYEVHNPTDRPIAGTASFNVSPDVAGGYFTKIACFCFDQQVLQPGETAELPVSFYVDPSILDDIDGQNVKSITLSYTFHVTDLPKAEAALEPATGAASRETPSATK